MAGVLAEAVVALAFIPLLREHHGRPEPGDTARLLASAAACGLVAGILLALARQLWTRRRLAALVVLGWGAPLAPLLGAFVWLRVDSGGSWVAPGPAGDLEALEAVVGALVLPTGIVAVAPSTLALVLLGTLCAVQGRRAGLRFVAALVAGAAWLVVALLVPSILPDHGWTGPESLTGLVVSVLGRAVAYPLVTAAVDWLGEGLIRRVAPSAAPAAEDPARATGPSRAWTGLVAAGAVTLLVAGVLALSAPRERAAVVLLRPLLRWSGWGAGLLARCHLDEPERLPRAWVLGPAGLVLPEAPDFGTRDARTGEAMSLLRGAAAVGNAEAMHQLALLARRRGRLRDDEAEAWIVRGTLLGHAGCAESFRHLRGRRAAENAVELTRAAADLEGTDPGEAVWLVREVREDGGAPGEALLLLDRLLARHPELAAPGDPLASLHFVDGEARPLDGFARLLVVHGGDPCYDPTPEDSTGFVYARVVQGQIVPGLHSGGMLLRAEFARELERLQAGIPDLEVQEPRARLVAGARLELRFLTGPRGALAGSRSARGGPLPHEYRVRLQKWGLRDYLSEQARRPLGTPRLEPEGWLYVEPDESRCFELRDLPLGEYRWEAVDAQGRAFCAGWGDVVAGRVGRIVVSAPR